MKLSGVFDIVILCCIENRVLSRELELHLHRSFYDRGLEEDFAPFIPLKCKSYGSKVLSGASRVLIKVGLQLPIG